MLSGHIELPAEDRCAFCDYLSGLRPFTILERTSLTATLVTREQRGAGHVLVLPLSHRRTILEVSDEEARWIMDAVVRVSRAIDMAFERPGLAIWQNNGVPAHQAIPHLHFHVAGTVDGGGTNWGDAPELGLDETNAIGSRLKVFLKPPPIALR